MIRDKRAYERACNQRGGPHREYWRCARCGALSPCVETGEWYKRPPPLVWGHRCGPAGLGSLAYLTPVSPGEQIPETAISYGV